MKYLLLLGLSLALIVNVRSQSDDWQLRKEVDNIRVYTKKSDRSELDEFKGVATIQTTIATLVNTLKSADQMHEWIPDCEVSNLIEYQGNRQVHYTVTKVPFPLQDRDAFVQFDYDSLSNGVRVHITALPEYRPSKDHIVRIPFLKGFWQFEYISEKETKVTYQLQADPGGSIPGWLANAGAVDTPFNTIKSLREYLK